MSSFLTGGGPAVKFENVGDTFEGQILSITEMEDRDPATGKTKTWDNGDPKKVWAFNCAPADGSEEEVTLWVRGNMVKAVKQAARDAKIKALEGCTIKVQHSELGKPKPGMNAAKLFRVKLTPGTLPASAFDPEVADDPF